MTRLMALAALVVLFFQSCVWQRPDAPVAAISKTAVADSVFTLEKNLWQAVKAQDKSVFEKSMAPDYTYVLGNGKHTETKAQSIEEHFSGGLRLDSFRISEVNTVWLNDSALLFRYNTKAWGSLEKVPMAEYVIVFSSWVKQGGKWLNKMSSEWPLDWNDRIPSGAPGRAPVEETK